MGKRFSALNLVLFVVGVIVGWLSDSSESFRRATALAFPVTSPLQTFAACAAVCCFSALGVTASVGFLLAIADRWRLAAFTWISTGILLVVTGVGAGVLALSGCSYIAKKPPEVPPILASVVFLVSGFAGICFAPSVARLFPDSMLGPGTARMIDLRSAAPPSSDESAGE